MTPTCRALALALIIERDRAQTAAGPLLGLFGTVVGMIQMFLGILDHGVGDVNQLAGGIGKALFTGKAGKGRVSETASVRVIGG